MSTEPPPPDLVPGEAPLWKMGDVKGFLVHQLVTGYLVTSYRCFIWDVRSNTVRVSVPVTLANLSVDGIRRGKRALRGGNFILPRTPDYIPPPMGEPVEVGNLVFTVEGETVMVFRDVSEPTKVKALIDALKQKVRIPDGLGVDFVWRSPSGVADPRARR